MLFTQSKSQPQRRGEYNVYSTFQSHEPEFDYLKSLEIEEKINKIRWLPQQNAAYFLLSTNGQSASQLWSRQMPADLFPDHLLHARLPSTHACKQTLLNIGGEASPDCRRHAWPLQNCKLGGADGRGPRGGYSRNLFLIKGNDLTSGTSTTEPRKIQCICCLCNLELKSDQIHFFWGGGGFYAPAGKCSQLVD